MKHIDKRLPPEPAAGRLIDDGGRGLFAARSLHPGGVHVAYADGSVKLLSDSIDLSVGRSIGSRNLRD